MTITVTTRLGNTQYSLCERPNGFVALYRINADGTTEIPFPEKLLELYFAERLLEAGPALAKLLLERRP